MSERIRKLEKELDSKHPELILSKTKLTKDDVRKFLWFMRAQNELFPSDQRPNWSRAPGLTDQQELPRTPPTVFASTPRKDKPKVFSKVVLLNHG
jgi:hypothetical protein